MLSALQEADDLSRAASDKETVAARQPLCSEFVPPKMT
jgi:hypothetical protein